MITPPALMAPSGRIFLRHPLQMGSIMVFNDRGTWRRVLVLDAKYRIKKVFGLYGIEISEFQEFELERPNSYWLEYPTERFTEAPDSWISENIAWDPLTSRERCDIWMKYKNMKDQSYSPGIIGCPAVQYCRDIQVNGTPCDLPNIQTLARIYIDRNTIDQMDPTVEEYSGWSLKEWDLRDNRFAWSSTECSSIGCWNMRCDGYVGASFRCHEYIIIPVFEL